MGRDEITNSIITNTIEELNPNHPYTKQAENKQWGQVVTSTGQRFKNEIKFTKHVTHQVPPGSIPSFKGGKILPSRKTVQPPVKKKPLKKNGENEEMYNIKYSSPEYDSKISELEKKSTDALKRLEAHIRSREIELKEKQDVELTSIKQSLLDVMKEKENGFFQRRNEIQAQEQRLEQLIEKQRQDHTIMQDQAQSEFNQRKTEIEKLEISSWILITKTILNRIEHRITKYANST